MGKSIIIATLMSVSFVLYQPDAHAHCQIPCGIYDDHARVGRMEEDLETIAKAVNEINVLAAKKDAQSQNQLVRWIMNKEQHAESIIRIISDYFLAQKIAPTPTSDKKAQAAYKDKLALHHAVMVAAMKCKQSSSREPVKALGQALKAIESFWPPSGK